MSGRRVVLPEEVLREALAKAWLEGRRSASRGGKIDDCMANGPTDWALFALFARPEVRSLDAADVA